MREGGTGAMFEEAMAENLPKLKKKSICRFNKLYESQVDFISTKKITPKHIIVKLPKRRDKEKTIQANRWGGGKEVLSQRI